MEPRSKNFFFFLNKIIFRLKKKKGNYQLSPMIWAYYNLITKCTPKFWIKMKLLTFCPN